MSAHANTMSKYFVFTWNNYTDDNISRINAFFEEYCTYGVYAREVGNSGTPHLQGYFELKIRKRVSSISRVLPGISLDKRRGSASQARDYCLKGDQSHAEWDLDGPNGANFGRNLDPDHYVFGEISNDHSGKRTDIDAVRDSIKSGDIKNQLDLLDQVRSMQSYKFGLEYLKCMDRDPVRVPPRVYWLYGSTGSGKSRAAHEFIQKVRRSRKWTYWKAFDGIKWFDGYCGQEIALFDDFRFDGNNTSFARLLQLTDRYSCTLPIKGGSTNWFPSIIIFTAPRPAQDILAAMREYRGGEDLGQFERRISFSGDFDHGGLDEFNQLLDTYLVERDAADAIVALPERGEEESKEEVHSDEISVADTVAYSIASDVSEYEYLSDE
jgi:hypothetical protein